MAPPKGNRNAAKGHMWAGAIRRALAEDREALQIAARALITKCKDGDLAAIKELGDRLDGKAAQSLELSGGLEMSKDVRDLTDEELAAEAARLRAALGLDGTGTDTPDGPQSLN
jgi:hypothetical protein